MLGTEEIEILLLPMRMIFFLRNLNFVCFLEILMTFYRLLL